LHPASVNSRVLVDMLHVNILPLHRVSVMVEQKIVLYTGLFKSL
jgi:hypothetical protein